VTPVSAECPYEANHWLAEKEEYNAPLKSLQWLPIWQWATCMYLSMTASDTAHNLNILRTCSTTVRDWYLSNNLLLNADKSDVLVLGTANRLRLAAAVDSIEVAGVMLPVATKLKSLGVILDQRLTFDDHASAVAKACSYTLELSNMFDIFCPSL